MSYEQTRDRLVEVVQDAINTELDHELSQAIKTTTRSAKFGYFNGREIDTRQLRCAVKRIKGKNNWYLISVDAGTSHEHEKLSLGLVNTEEISAKSLVTRIADIERIGIESNKLRVDHE